MAPVFADDNDRINWFFDDPSTSPGVHSRNGAHSVLYVLRRELIETIGYDPKTTSEQELDRQGGKCRLFASVILMFTMVDLLAKYMFGDAGGVGDRFKRFLQSSDGGQLALPQAELLWAVRNSLVHAFGLPDSVGLATTGHRSVAIGKRKQLNVGGFSGLVVIEHQGDTAVVYVDGLFRKVVESIRRYQETLVGTGSTPARQAFVAAFSSYGWIMI